MKSSTPISSHCISCDTGVIDVHVFEPGVFSSIRGTIVTVHPWSALGGGEHNTIGLARHIVKRNFNKSEKMNRNEGWRVVTFTLESNSFWQGGPIGGIFSNHTFETQQIVDVVRWVRQKYGEDEKIVLLGSSAGAPMAGTAMHRLHNNDQNGKVHIDAYVAVGYTFGNFAALGFGRHFSSILSSSLSTTPKLFIMGEKDEFTSVEQLEKIVQKIRALNRSNEGYVDVDIVPKVGHFELESPRYDPLVAKSILDWLDKRKM